MSNSHIIMRTPEKDEAASNREVSASDKGPVMINRDVRVRNRPTAMSNSIQDKDLSTMDLRHLDIRHHQGGDIHTSKLPVFQVQPKKVTP